ncbi:FprA family A-type flavoprotein [Crassaminicella indica]|uniref:FprA family A-type flavoprotein n=1 Tax=Crassaminicella indica TaxID=2855394 RepID=A0ABX8RDC7_9CLOT|nr:FprA family A-type flavoprotein [Crassaminicella indica]QXM07038.1 FprA family A-type flavoprotein [Crassaminicella indica]
MQPVELKKDIYWVGAIDWDLRNFHGYLTQRGSSYNAYLIIDEKITLIDTVKGLFADELLDRVSKIIDPSKIDYIVSNHVEMDHSGSLPKILELAKNATVITSPNGLNGLKAHYKKNWNFKIIKSGEHLSLGKRTLEFILTPMVHWPDNMVCYIPQEKILFSNDAFGQHIASTERFDDMYSFEVVMEEAKKYYANIVLPYGTQVQNVLKSVSGLDIKMIATSHGLIWREHISKIVEEYTKWASNKTEKKAVIVYDTMWNSTKKIASKIQQAFEDKGYKTILKNLQTNHISDIMTDIITSEYICVGSPTLNNNMMPNTAGFLTYLKGLAPKNRKAIAFGSYGWGGQSIKQIADALTEAGFKVEDNIKINYIPNREDLNKMIELLKEKL